MYLKYVLSFVFKFYLLFLVFLHLFLFFHSVNQIVSVFFLRKLSDLIEISSR